MIAFASSITDVELYRRAAEPGIERAKEPDSLVIANAAAGSIFRSYNLLLDLAAERDDLEALVLLHQDTEIADPDFCARLRGALADPDVGVVGAVGAVGVRSIAWWEGSVTWASFTHRYREFGGGQSSAFSYGEEPLPSFAREGEVDAVDGFLLALSPWVVRNVRFDESLGQLHGYDFDFCQQVRAAGRKVVAAHLRAIHHHSLELVSNPESWLSAHMRLAEKWEDRLPGTFPQGDWKQRARRAEAEAALARTESVGLQMRHEAEIQQVRRDLEEAEASISWRITAPLRKLNAARRARTKRAA